MKEIKACFTPPSGAIDAVEPIVLKIAGVYCDLSLYTMAAHQLYRIGERCPSNFRLNSTWWSFESLKDPGECDTAVRMAAEADIIWCSACLCQPLPNAVKSWLDTWSALKRKGDGALVSHLRCPFHVDIDQSSTRRCLALAAQTAGMAIFERRLTDVCDHQHPSLTESRTSPLFETAGALRRVRDWGINE